MAGFEITQQAIFGGSLFLLGFFIFIVLYIIVRIWAERRGHEHGEVRNKNKGRNRK